MPSDIELEKEHSFTLFQSILLLFIIGLLFGIVIFFDKRLPTPLTYQDEHKYPDAFIAERAKNDLVMLTKNGSRVVGSFENEIGAVNFLYQELISTTNPLTCYKKVSIDIQNVSGSYYIDYKPYGAYNAYGNVQNVIVKAYARNPSNNSILINSHFDSVPTSPGGSDDGIMCVVMLEVIRKLCQSKDELLHNVIFLFNGAEETPLLASHGFITQHKWAKEIQIVINLEASGSGNKEILFQSGPDHSWLLDYYSKVPHPHAQVAAEEVFQSNIIPSDTDFRIFRDFGNVVGFDLAFYQNGYKYHTNYDDVDSIPLGSYQHVGDNLLSLVKSIANAPEVYNLKKSYGKAIYFDVFGLFMVSYKVLVGTIINTLVSVSSCLIAYMSFTDFKLGGNKTNIFFIMLTTIAILLGWTFAGIGTISIAILIDVLNYSMSWYANPYLVFGLYAVPTMLLSSLPLVIWNYINRELHLSARVQSQIQFSIVRLIWTLLLLAMTCIKIRSAYSLMIVVMFNTVGCIIIHLTRLHHSVHGWKIVYLLCNMLPSMMLFNQAYLALSMFIPVTGRIGSNKNPEVLIGIMTMVLTILISSFYMNFLTLMRKPFWLLYGFLIIFFIHFLIMVTPWGFPYSGDATSPAQQRFMIYHTGRIITDQGLVTQDSGYFIINLDRNSPRSVQPYVHQFEKSVSVNEDCNKFLVCGLPLSTPRMLPVMQYSSWIPAEEPIITENIFLKLNSKTFSKTNIVKFNLTAEGPDHFNLYFSPKAGVHLINVSFDNAIPEYVPMWNERPVYFINYVWGISKTPLTFIINLQVPEYWRGVVLDIGISGKYVHDKRNKYTAQFRSFLNDFPKWANVVPAIASFESWEM